MSTALRTYYRGDELVGLRDGQANATRYYHFDHQGTTQCLTDRTSAVTDRFASDAWGVQVKRTGSSINRQWYVGNSGYQACDATMRLYVRQRYYLAARGRWGSRDLISPYYASYPYTKNIPSYMIDPLGLMECKITELKGEWIGDAKVRGPITVDALTSKVLAKRTKRVCGTVVCKGCCSESFPQYHFYQWLKGKERTYDPVSKSFSPSNHTGLSHGWQPDQDGKTDAGTFLIREHVDIDIPDNYCVITRTWETCDSPGVGPRTVYGHPGCKRLSTWSPVPMLNITAINGTILGLDVQVDICTGFGKDSQDSLSHTVQWGANWGWFINDRAHNNNKAYYRSTGGDGCPKSP